MINFKVRFKNPTFWIQLIISIGIAILAYMGLTIQDLTSWGIVRDAFVAAVKTPYVWIMAGTIAYNAIIDPTTTGISDSKRAMEYDEPNGD